MPVVTHEIPAAERIRKARTALLLDHPFFGSLLFRLKGEECRSIPTMATNGVVLDYLGSQILLRLRRRRIRMQYEPAVRTRESEYPR